MSPDAHAILDDLQAVARLRMQLALDPGLARGTLALKDYQARRFERTYADVLTAGNAYRDAALFFLEELYAAKEFAHRDEQFARIVPSVARIFSDDVVSTVSTLATLHATTERLDVDMAGLLPTDGISRLDYIHAWQLCGRYEQRWRQLAMTLEIGRALQHHTRSATVRRLLRLMRSPAKVAGLGELQRFLERGFDTFGRMSDSAGFLQTVEHRERAIIAALCDPASAAALRSNEASRARAPLDQLP